jgi:hypothetical protein
MISKTSLALTAAVAAAVALVSMTDGLAAGGVFTRGCAARDIQIMMMLETSAISPQHKNDAVRTVIHARMMCFDGQVMDALALYDGVARSIATDWALSSQEP